MKKATNKISHALLTEGREYSERILKGLSAGVSHFHAVRYMCDELDNAGFKEIKEV